MTDISQNKIFNAPILVTVEHPEKPNNTTIYKKKMKKKKIIKRNLEEFKSWILGFQEFQNEDWHPNYEQWEHIKDSINAIKETNLKSKSSEMSSTVYEQPIRRYANPVHSSLDVSPVPTITSSSPHIDMRNSSNTTQNIDTSDGNYKSDFE